MLTNSLKNRKNRVRLLLLFIGLGLVIVLIVQSDIHNLSEGLHSIGWFILPITLFHCIPLYLHTMGWRQLLKNNVSIRSLRLLEMRWITESVNNLLPVAQIGGEVVRARLLTKHGVNGAIASSAVFADFSVGLFTQTLFTLVGVLFLFNSVGPGDFATQAATGVLLLLAVLAGFVYFQSRGLSKIISYMVARSANQDRWQPLVKNSEQFATQIKRIYSGRRNVLFSFCWRLSAWFAGTGETFLILYALDISVPLFHLVILESFAFAARSLGFLIPGAIGVTEGALVLVGTLLGLTPAQALTLALAKRARELLLGVPGLVIWLSHESRSIKQTS